MDSYKRKELLIKISNFSVVDDSDEKIAIQLVTAIKNENKRDLIAFFKNDLILLGRLLSGIDDNRDEFVEGLLKLPLDADFIGTAKFAYNPPNGTTLNNEFSQNFVNLIKKANETNTEVLNINYDGIVIFGDRLVLNNGVECTVSIGFPNLGTDIATGGAIIQKKIKAIKPLKSDCDVVVEPSLGNVVKMQGRVVFRFYEASNIESPQYVSISVNGNYANDLGKYLFGDKWNEDEENYPIQKLPPSLSSYLPDEISFNVQEIVTVSPVVIGNLYTYAFARQYLAYYPKTNKLMFFEFMIAPLTNVLVTHTGSQSNPLTKFINGEGAKRKYAVRDFTFSAFLDFRYYFTFDGTNFADKAKEIKTLDGVFDDLKKKKPNGKDWSVLDIADDVEYITKVSVQKSSWKSSAFCLPCLYFLLVFYI